jgi:hypothetical protein
MSGESLTTTPNKLLCLHQLEKSNVRKLTLHKAKLLIAIGLIQEVS